MRMFLFVSCSATFITLLLWLIPHAIRTPALASRREVFNRTSLSFKGIEEFSDHVTMACLGLAEAAQTLATKLGNPALELWILLHTSLEIDSIGFYSFSLLVFYLTNWTETPNWVRISKVAIFSTSSSANVHISRLPVIDIQYSCRIFHSECSALAVLEHMFLISTRLASSWHLV